MPDLFDHALNERMNSEAPLAARMDVQKSFFQPTKQPLCNLSLRGR